MSKIFVPPIKCQGIKTKLVPFIQQHVPWDGNGRWIEPFMGSGVVGFNMRAKRAIFADSNPHIINFYNSINQSTITPAIVRSYLEQEGALLLNGGKEYYYHVRQRFNEFHAPLDFLFLTRAGFNGMIRFNQKGKHNVPFNHKPNRFAKAYVTKVVNQVNYVYDLCRMNEYLFVCQDFRKTIQSAEKEDFIYCDPPYAGRHVDYYNGWSEQDEVDLFDALEKVLCKFILSTWHSNEHRYNPAIDVLAKKHHIVTREHFYHVGAKESNRKPMLEALVLNYKQKSNGYPQSRQYQQARLLEPSENVVYQEKE